VPSCIRHTPNKYLDCSISNPTPFPEPIEQACNHEAGEGENDGVLRSQIPDVFQQVDLVDNSAIAIIHIIHQAAAHAPNIISDICHTGRWLFQNNTSGITSLTRLRRSIVMLKASLNHLVANPDEVDFLLLFQ
jgi:hypothetical protein